jgi:hypothetical protein
MLRRGHLHLTGTLRHYQRAKPRITQPSIVATPVRSVGPYFRPCAADQHYPFLC